MGMAIKYTNQRIEILNFLKDNLSHPTVEQVYDGVRKRLTRISKATVYQNLRFLAQNGMIQEVNIKGVSRFEPKLATHHHLLCRECGKIIDFYSDELNKYSMNLAKKIKKMKIESTNTNFYGICQQCDRK